MCSGNDEMCVWFDGENGTSREFQSVDSITKGIKRDRNATASEGDPQTNQINKQSREKLRDREYRSGHDHRAYTIILCHGPGL